MTKFLENDEIRLRAVEPGDSDMMWEIETDSTQWLDNGMVAPYSHHNIEEYAKNYDADPIRSGQLRLVCEIKKDERGKTEFLGLADIYDISAICRTAFIGIYIIGQNRRLGYATQVLTLVEKYCRQLLNLRILATKISDSNTASIRLFIKSGYKQTGELPHWLLSGKETHSLLIFTKSL